jgi:Tfp pilus assembly protein PilV
MTARPTRRLGPLSGEGGFTLPEVLLALIFLGTVIAAVILTMGASIMASDFHRKTVTADSIARTYAERIQTVGYIECATSPGHPAPAYLPVNMFTSTQFPGFTPANMSITVQYWDNGATPAGFSTSCPSNPDNGVQLITITVPADGNRGKQTLDVIKRRPS